MIIALALMPELAKQYRRDAIAAADRSRVAPRARRRRRPRLNGTQWDELLRLPAGASPGRTRRLSPHTP